MADKGTLYFFTGLAGAGKSTIGGLFYERLKEKRPDAILQDGDGLRNKDVERGVFRGYTTQGRLEGARLAFADCLDLTNEGHDVVLCCIAMYEEIRSWARDHIEHYKEIYIRVPMEILYQRDQGGIYSSGISNVVGVDLPWDEPTSSDVIVDNTGKETPEAIVDRLVAEFGISVDESKEQEAI